MSESVVYTLIAVGLLVCAGLLVFIFRQRAVIKAAQAEQDARTAEAEAKAKEHREYLIESVHVIASAMIHDERMTLTEGTIRLSVLLDNLAPQLKQDPEFRILAEVYAKVQHIPFLDGWKQLDRQQQWKYQQEMKKVEAEHRDALMKMAEQLSTFPFEKTVH